MQTEGLVNNQELRRYEYYIDGQLAAFEDYTLTGSTLSLIHTEALPGFSGTGAAKNMVRGILQEAHANGLQVLPFCGYVARFIGKHAEQFLHLVPSDKRASFNLPADAGHPTHID